MIHPALKIALDKEQAAEAVGLTPGEFEGAVGRGEMPKGKKCGRRNIWSVKALREAIDGPLHGEIDLDKEFGFDG